MSHPGSHSEAFGLKGQDEPGFPTEVVGNREGAGSTEGGGVLGGAGHPTGAAPSDPEHNVHQQSSSGLKETEESTVGGMKQGTDDNTVPGSGGSLKPNQGTGQVSEQQSTADILNPAK